MFGFQSALARLSYNNIRLNFRLCIRLYLGWVFGSSGILKICFSGIWGVLSLKAKPAPHQIHRLIDILEYSIYTILILLTYLICLHYHLKIYSLISRKISKFGLVIEKDPKYIRLRLKRKEISMENQLFQQGGDVELNCVFSTCLFRIQGRVKLRAGQFLLSIFLSDFTLVLYH